MKNNFAVLSILAALCLCGCSKTPDVQNATDIQSDNSIQVVMWNDYHSALYESLAKDEPDVARGGLPVWMSAVEKLKGDGLSLVLDAGDMFQGATPLNEARGLGMIKIMNDVGLDVTTFGNHEFDYGVAEDPEFMQGSLVNAINASQFQWVSANVVANDDYKAWPPEKLKPYTILEKGPYRIAVTGVSTYETVSTTNSTNITGLSFNNPAQTLSQVIPEIVKEDPDFIIVLGHLTGAPSPMPSFGEVSTTATFNDELGEIMALPEEIRDHIDLLVTGHLHISFLYDNGRTVITQGHNGGQELTTLKLVPKKDGHGLEIDRASIQKYDIKHAPIYRGCDGGFERPEAIDVNGMSLTPDARAYEHIESLESSMVEGLCDVMTCTTEPFIRKYDNESAIGDLIVDATASIFPEADGALLNSGGLRIEWPQGNIYRELVSAMMPFENYAYLVEMSGEELIRVLKIASTGHHGVMQVNGITYAYQPNCGRANEDINNDGTIDAWEASCLCEGAKIGGKPIDPKARYKIVMSDFIFNGGDSLAGIFTTSKKLEEGPVIRKAIMDYVTKHEGCFDPKQIVIEDQPRIQQTTCSAFMK